ncbi:MAG: hypothetical protein V9G14_02985 [Cypionkella sp.]
MNELRLSLDQQANARIALKPNPTLPPAIATHAGARFVDPNDKLKADFKAFKTVIRRRIRSITSTAKDASAKGNKTLKVEIGYAISAVQ